jgi:hypothetical protein
MVLDFNFLLHYGDTTFLKNKYVFNLKLYSETPIYDDNLMFFFLFYCCTYKFNGLFFSEIFGSESKFFTVYIFNH